jgi:hypothetical protein
MQNSINLQATLLPGVGHRALVISILMSWHVKYQINKIHIAYNCMLGQKEWGILSKNVFE